MGDINREDFITGRIYQSVLNRYVKNGRKGLVSISHGVHNSINISSVIDGLFCVLPKDTTIALRKLRYGYEIIITTYPLSKEATW